jgi:hypothetical protein
VTHTVPEGGTGLTTRRGLHLCPSRTGLYQEKKKKKRLLLYNMGNVLLKKSKGATNDKEILGKKT